MALYKNMVLTKQLYLPKDNIKIKKFKDLL